MTNEKRKKPDVESDLANRMAEIENRVAKSGNRGAAAKVAGAAVAALAIGFGGYAIVDAVSQPSEQTVAIPSSGTQEYPEDRGASDSLAMPSPPDPVFVDRPVVTTQTDSATLARLADLEADLAAARSLAAAREDETEQQRALREELERERDKFAADIAALRSTAENDQDRARDTMEQLQESVSALRIDLSDSQRDIAAEQTRSQQALLAQAENFQRQLREARAVDPLEQDRMRLEQERLAREAEDRQRLEELRAERAADERTRAESNMIAVNNSGASEAGAAEGRDLNGNESFVQRNVGPVPVSRALQISAPHATVPQGTIIQASLETAVDSTLPGPIRGVVSEDVHSMDGSAILIPAGSKVFGEYSSGIALGQKRILIVWTRILTPSNRSISIASYGADRLGRSGTGGAVDTRFGTRFTGAAAISIIGATPAIIASQQDNVAVARAVEDIGDDFSEATDSAIGQYLTLPPTIYVRQGTSVTIIVDRDLEIF